MAKAEGQLDSVIVNGEEWIPLNGAKKDLERPVMRCKTPSK